MNDKTWRRKIFGPYNDTWKIIRILQHVSDDNPQLFLEYMDQVQKFEDAYKGNEFAEFLRQAVLLHVDNIIAGLNRKEP